MTTEFPNPETCLGTEDEPVQNSIEMVTGITFTQQSAQLPLSLIIFN